MYNVYNANMRICTKSNIDASNEGSGTEPGKLVSNKKLNLIISKRNDIILNSIFN